MFGINVSLFTPPSPEEEKIIKAFLEEHGLVYEGKPDASVIVEDPQGRVIATGSLSGKVLKMLAIDQEWREANLSGTIMTRLIEYSRISFTPTKLNVSCSLTREGVILC